MIFRLLNGGFTVRRKVDFVLTAIVYASLLPEINKLGDNMHSV